MEPPERLSRVDEQAEYGTCSSTPTPVVRLDAITSPSRRVGWIKERRVAGIGDLVESSPHLGRDSHNLTRLVRSPKGPGPRGFGERFDSAVVIAIVLALRRLGRAPPSQSSN